MLTLPITVDELEPSDGEPPHRLGEEANGRFGGFTINGSALNRVLDLFSHRLLDRVYRKGCRSFGITFTLRRYNVVDDSLLQREYIL